MTIDKSLKRKALAGGIRSVLTRLERIEQMKREETWKEGMSPVGMPKTRIVRISTGKKKKVKKEEGDAAKGGKGAKGGKAAGGGKAAAKK